MWFKEILFFSGQGVAVERIIELVTHRTLYPEIQTQLHFIKENCYRLMYCLTSLEASNTPLACSVFNTLEDLRSYLLVGVSKTRFGEETDRYLQRSNLSDTDPNIQAPPLTGQSSRAILKSIIGCGYRCGCGML